MTPCSKIELGVNIDHIATLRQARLGTCPDPIEAAQTCERAGADGIVCHLREDRRHIQDKDVERLRKVITTHLNLEMSIAPEIIDIALSIKPNQVTLVPEKRQELTTEGGLNVANLSNKLIPIIDRFHEQRISVSLFIDPVIHQISAAKDAGATIVELHTGCYAGAETQTEMKQQLASLQQAALAAEQFGLTVAAGHGLDYVNIQQVIQINQIKEVNIGFAIIAEAFRGGLNDAVTKMVNLLKGPSSHANQSKSKNSVAV